MLAVLLAFFRCVPSLLPLFPVVRGHPFSMTAGLPFRISDKSPFFSLASSPFSFFSASLSLDRILCVNTRKRVHIQAEETQWMHLRTNGCPNQFMNFDLSLRNTSLADFAHWESFQPICHICVLTLCNMGDKCFRYFRKGSHAFELISDHFVLFFLFRIGLSFFSNRARLLSFSHGAVQGWWLRRGTSKYEFKLWFERRSGRKFSAVLWPRTKWELDALAGAEISRIYEESVVLGTRNREAIKTYI